MKMSSWSFKIAFVLFAVVAALGASSPTMAGDAEAEKKEQGAASPRGVALVKRSAHVSAASVAAPAPAQVQPPKPATWPLFISNLFNEKNPLEPIKRYPIPFGVKLGNRIEVSLFPNDVGRARVVLNDDEKTALWMKVSPKAGEGPSACANQVLKDIVGIVKENRKKYPAWSRVIPA